MLMLFVSEIIMIGVGLVATALLWSWPMALLVNHLIHYRPTFRHVFWTTLRTSFLGIICGLGGILVFLALGVLLQVVGIIRDAGNMPPVIVAVIALAACFACPVYFFPILFKPISGKRISYGQSATIWLVPTCGNLLLVSAALLVQHLVSGQ